MLRFLRSYILTIFLLLILVALAISIGFLYGKKPSWYVNTDRVSILKEVKQLQRLETAQYNIEKIVDAGTTGSSLNQLLFGDKLLLIAHGEVIAGFDLSNLKENDIYINGTKITIQLPAAQILMSRLDNEKTEVYDRRTGILTKGNIDLETQARAEAEKSIRQAACDSDILATAAENGKKQLMTVFNGLGFADVTIDISAGTCE